MNEIRLIQQQPSVKPFYQRPLVVQQPYAGPLAPTGEALPGVYTITAPDGSVHHVYGPATGQPVVYANTPLPAAETTRPLVHPWVANLAIGAGALALVGIGLHFLIGFVVALAQLVTALVTLVAVLAGAYVAFQLLSANRGGGRGGNVTNVNIKKAVFKRSTFRS